MKLLQNQQLLQLLETETSKFGEKQQLWIERYLYIYTLILTRQINNHLGAPIHYRIEKGKLNISGSKDYTRIFNFFKQHNIISVSRERRVRTSCRRYTVQTYFQQGKVVESKVLELKNEHQDYGDLLNKYFQYLNEITVELPEINDISEVQEVILNRIQNKDHYIAQPHEDSRIYTLICNLKKENRQYLRWNNNTLNQVDISASQIVIAIGLYNKQYGELPKDVQELLNICKNGNIYSTLNCTKEEFYKNIWYNKAKYMNNELSNTFKELFPSLWNFIYSIKVKHGNKKLAMLLQKYEYQVISKSIEYLYNKNIPCISLHDSIIFPDINKSGVIKMVMENTFNNIFGIKIGLKISKF